MNGSLKSPSLEDYISIETGKSGKYQEKKTHETPTEMGWYCHISCPNNVLQDERLSRCGLLADLLRVKTTLDAESKAESAPEHFIH